MLGKHLLLSSVILEIIFLVIVFCTTGAGHGTYVPAAIIFPYWVIVMLLSQNDLAITISVVLMLFLYPIYAILLLKSRKGRSFGLVKFGLVSIHFIASAIANYLYHYYPHGL